MKRIYNVSIIFAAILAITVNSCQKIDNTTEYLNVSISHYTFMGTVKDTLRVCIKSNPAWDSSTDQSWVKYEKKQDTLLIYPENNTTGEERSAKIGITAGNLEKDIQIIQLSERFKGHFEDMYYFGHNIVMSTNGNYVIGCLLKELREDASIYTPLLINTRTGEKKYLQDQQGWDQTTAISGDGRYIAYQDVSGTRTMLRIDDEEVKIKLPEGYRNPRIQYISTDGSIMTGYCQSLSSVDGWKPYLSVKWTNGEPEILESPDHNIWGDKCTLDVMARGSSDDGSIIYGSEWNDRGVIYWKNGEIFFPGYEFADKITNRTVILEAELTNISPNGKYIGCGEAELYTGSFPIKTPAVINTERNELILLEGSDEGSCIHVTNDGTAFIACPTIASSYGFAADLETKTIVPVDEWMKSNYGITISSNRYIKRISEDGKVIFGIQTIQTALGPGFIPWYCYTGE